MVFGLSAIVPGVCIHRSGLKISINANKLKEKNLYMFHVYSKDKSSSRESTKGHDVLNLDEYFVTNIFGVISAVEINGNGYFGKLPQLQVNMMLNEVNKVKCFYFTKSNKRLYLVQFCLKISMMRLVLVYNVHNRKIY